MSKGGGEVKETAQQRAMTEFAVNRLQDYQKRWLPLQRRLAAQVSKSGASDSAQRKETTGRANVDSQIAFSEAQGALEKKLAGAGVGLGSGRQVGAESSLSDDKAVSRGMGQVTADQSVDDAYTQALASLAATGRGEAAAVGSALTQQAAMSATQAQADAQAALEKQGAVGQAIGNVAGYGLQAAMRPTPKKSPLPTGTTPTVLGAQADDFYTNPQAGK
ncbi:MAG: hypothetical protein AB7F22_05370 [Reyranella sp.]|uniref:hypothetical protein n=1 Tax=Reyranella sp. TaxID=1929291 RepID=UPI003D11024C